MLSDIVSQRILPLNDRELCPYEDVLLSLTEGDSSFLNHS